MGQNVRMAGATFAVIGVLAPKGVAADGADADNQVFVPIGTALHRIFNSRSLTAVFVGVRDTIDLDPAERQIRALLRERHRLERRSAADDFAVQNQLRFLSAQRQTTRVLAWFTSGLAAVSLFVGGTGILALMLLSVRERTPEIGLRMAVGARRSDILLQFLAEAMVLAVAGGIAGVVLGAMAAWGVALATGWPIRASVAAVLTSLATATIVGVGFGSFPARKAALIPPVAAFARR